MTYISDFDGTLVNSMPVYDESSDDLAGEMKKVADKNIYHFGEL